MFPLNAAYGTKDVKNSASPGSPVEYTFPQDLKDSLAAPMNLLGVQEVT